jgi:hypothetical protein
VENINTSTHGIFGIIEIINKHYFCSPNQKGWSMEYSDQMPVPMGKRKDTREGNMNVPMQYDTLIGKIPPHSMDAEMAIAWGNALG